MTDDVKPEVIKKTQELLGKYFKKPPLTEKLLKKPPFRFLHDIVSAVIKETGFLDGLFTEEELNSDNIKDKEAKLAYLTKLIDVVKLITGINLTVRATKIISGQEATKTNELLQAIGKALDRKVSSTESIDHYKKTLEKKAKSNSKNKTTSKEEKRTSLRQASQVRKPQEKEKSSTEQKRRSSSASKVKENEAELREDGKKIKDRAVEKTVNENEEIYKNTEMIEIPPAEPLQEKIPSSAQRRKHSSSAKTKQNRISSAASSELTKLNSVQANSTAEKKTDEYTRRKDSANKTKRSLQNQSSESRNLIASAGDAGSLDSKSIENDKENTDNIENKENGVLPDNEIQKTEKSEHLITEPQKSNSEDVEQSTLQQSASRPRTSLRPPTARPISARPAAPRMRAKTDLIMNEEISTPVGTISVIIENSDAKEDDDADDMVVMETRGGGGDSLENSNNYKIDNQLTQEHGHLVAQILETQRELVNNENVDILPKKADIAWDTSSKRDREVITKEIDKLRSTIQTLTRATNPLGKLLDYLQEDVEMMQKELMEWRSQYSKLHEQLEKEKVQTRELIEPMKETLKEIDNNIKIQLDRICQAKSQIMKNDQKIQRLLNGNM